MPKGDAVKISNKRALPWLLAILLIQGCTPITIQNIRIDNNAAISDKSGYLFLAVDTDQNLNSIALSGKYPLILGSRDLVNGMNYILAEVPAGKYSFKEVYLRSAVPGYTRYYSLKNTDKLWTFTIKPNAINYLGCFTVETKENRGHFEMLNEASVALEYLEEKYPSILARNTLN